MGPLGRPDRTTRDASSTWRRNSGFRISPIFLGIVAAAVVSAVALAQGFGRPGPAVFVFVLASYFTVLCLHEFGHAYAAHRAGDRSVQARGYLDLNPLRYLNPVLSIVLPVFYLAIGGLPLPGGAVRLDPGVVRKRWQASLVSASGPAWNIAFGAISLVAIALWAPKANSVTTVDQLDFWAAVGFFAYIQVAVSVLNLIPVPGLDGFGIIEPYLRYETRRGLDPIRPYGILIVLVLLVFIPPARTGFSDAVNSILGAFGMPQGLPGYGQTLFQFWRG